MAYINDEDMVEMVSKYCGVTKSAVREIRKAECDITKRLLKSGHKISFGSLGKFYLKDHPAKEGRKFKQPWNNEWGWIEPKPAYQSPDFHYIKTFVDEIRAITEDNLL